MIRRIGIVVLLLAVVACNTSANTSAKTSAKTTPPTSVASTTGNAGPVFSQITAAGTACKDFAQGAAKTLDHVAYSLKNNLISAVTPDQFDYWVKVRPSQAQASLTITQSADEAGYILAVAPGSAVYSNALPAIAPCTSITNSIQPTPDTPAPTVAVNINGVQVGATVYVDIKLSAGTLSGGRAPRPKTVTFTIGTTIGTTDMKDSVRRLSLTKA